MFTFNKEKHYRVFNERKFRRFKVPYLLKHRPAGSEEEWTVSNLKDLSAGGLKFWTDKFYAEGSFIQLLLWIPLMDRQIMALGRVVRSVMGKIEAVFYISVAFLEIPRGDQEILKTFIDRFSSQRETKDLVDHKEIAERRLPVTSVK